MTVIPGAIVKYFFGVNLLTLFSKLDLFHRMWQVLISFIKWSSLQRNHKHIYAWMFLRNRPQLSTLWNVNKQECFFRASLVSLVYCLRVRLEQWCSTEKALSALDLCNTQFTSVNYDYSKVNFSWLRLWSVYVTFRPSRKLRPSNMWEHGWSQRGT